PEPPPVPAPEAPPADCAAPPAELPVPKLPPTVVAGPAPCWLDPPAVELAPPADVELPPTALPNVPCCVLVAEPPGPPTPPAPPPARPCAPARPPPPRTPGARPPVPAPGAALFPDRAPRRVPAVAARLGSIGRRRSTQRRGDGDVATRSAHRPVRRVRDAWTAAPRCVHHRRGRPAPAPPPRSVPGPPSFYSLPPPFLFPLLFPLFLP